MNKAELINAVAAKADVSKKDAEAVVAAMLDAVTDALQNGDKVQLVGFGSFEVKKRAERIGRNPKTKESIKIPAAEGPRVQGRQGAEGYVAKYSGAEVWKPPAGFSRKTISCAWDKKRNRGLIKRRPWPEACDTAWCW